MRRNETLPIVAHKRQQVGTLLGRKVDLADAKEENRVEIVEITDIEFLARRDARASRKRDRVLGDEL